MELDAISVFVKVVQAGSFTQAAKQLGMPNSTVSARVATLERRLGTTLIHRTTRKISVTEAGEAYFRRCVQALGEIEAAESEIASTQKDPRGVLRLTAPVDLGHTLLPGIVQTLLKRHPDLGVDLVITNRVVDLVGEGIDVAIRAGELEDSTMIAKGFVSSKLEFYASPAYLKKAGTPSAPKDLERHALIRFTDGEATAPTELEVSDGKTSVRVRVGGRIQADDLETIKIFAVRGEGIGCFPGFICEDEIEKGKLVRVLPKWYFGDGHFSLVYPAQRFVSPKIQAFIKAAAEMRERCTVGRETRNEKTR